MDRVIVFVNKDNADETTIYEFEKHIARVPIINEIVTLTINGIERKYKIVGVDHMPDLGSVICYYSK